MRKPPRHRTSSNAAANSPSAPAPSFRRVISSASSTGSAPSSVMCVPASPLTRELSDLSGSYMNGNTAPRSSFNRSFSVCSEEPVPGFWRQAHILSPPPPRESAPPASPVSRSSTTSALIVVERNGVIELVKKSDADSSSEENPNNEKNTSQHDQECNNDSSFEDLMFLAHNSPGSLLFPPNRQHTNDIDQSCSRIPILILLMDPGRKQYELMQLWVDPEADLVRDVLHSLQRQLSDKWRQDYDGLFQLRGKNYCQLVHILGIAKYDIRPREVWVAKPWSMAAKPT